MDRLAGILHCQWRAYWRRFWGAGSLRASNAGVLVLVAGLGVMRYVQQLPLAMAQVENGETSSYETKLLVVFIFLMVVVMGESGHSITARQLLHFPLSVGDLFVIRVISIFYSPVTWIVLAAALALGLVVAVAPHAFLGALALFTFMLLGLFTSLTILHLLNSAWARKLLLVVVLVISAAGTLLWIGQRTDVAATLRSLTPARLTVAAAVSPTPVRSLLILASITLLVALLAFFTFPLTLQPRQARRSQTLTLLGLVPFPGKFGGLVKKDLRYVSRLLDIYLALPLIVFFNIYLVSDTQPSAVVFGIIIGALFLTCCTIAFNCFGLDRPTGMDRYSLFPLSGKEKVFSKNLAFATLMLLLFLTILPRLLWTLGFGAGVQGLMELIAVGLAYVSYGNWLSVKHPFKMQFYRFASGGSPVDALMGMIFGSIPAAVAVILFYRNGGAALWKLGVMLIVYAALYLISLSYSARVLVREQENIRRALT